MILHLIYTCSAFNYKSNITVETIKQKQSTIIIEYNGKLLTIPHANIAAIEEQLNA